MTGRIKEILITKQAGGEIISISSAQLQTGKGIVGDRYYSTQGIFSKQLTDQPDFEVTLIEQEQIEQFQHTTKLAYVGADFRRNIVTQHIRLNDLVDKEFTIGKVKLRGVRLCEPCAYLSSLLGPEVLKHMVHKAGLRAQIISSGDIHINDEIIV